MSETELSTCKELRPHCPAVALRDRHDTALLITVCDGGSTAPSPTCETGESNRGSTTSLWSWNWTKRPTCKASRNAQPPPVFSQVSLDLGVPPSIIEQRPQCPGVLLVSSPRKLVERLTEVPLLARGGYGILL